MTFHAGAGTVRPGVSMLTQANAEPQLLLKIITGKPEAQGMLGGGHEPPPPPAGGSATMSGIGTSARLSLQVSRLGSTPGRLFQAEQAPETAVVERVYG